MSQARLQKRMRGKPRRDEAHTRRHRTEDRAAPAESPTDRDDDQNAPRSGVSIEIADLDERFDDDIELDESAQRKHELRGCHV